MNPLIILGALTVGPVLILMALRINAALVFLSLCLGNVLVQLMGPDASSLLTMLNTKAVPTHPLAASNQTLSIVLLVLPAVLTMIFMIKSVHGLPKLAFNLLPALGVGLLVGLLVVPLLPASQLTGIVASPVWLQVQRAQVLIVGVSALICLLSIWLQRPKKHAHEESGGKHHGH